MDSLAGGGLRPLACKGVKDSGVPMARDNSQGGKVPVIVYMSNRQSQVPGRNGGSLVPR